MKLQIDAACCSHVGAVRSKNEDNYFFSNQYARIDDLSVRPTMYRRFSEGPVCFGVFDGLGGCSDGDAAAFRAAETFSHDCEQLSNGAMLSEFYFRNAILHMNEAICVEAENQKSNMGSTAVIAGFCEDAVYLSNIGDSRAYRYRDKELRQLSVDHVEEIPPYLRSNKRKKPGLSQHLGIGAGELTLEPHVGRGTIEPGDIYVLCSDGLTDMLTEAQIAAVLEQDKHVIDCVETLVKQAIEAGGIDNITVIAIKILRGGNANG